MSRAAPLTAVVVAVLASTLLTGCRVTFGQHSGDPTPEPSAALSVARTQRFEVGLSGPFPTREQVGMEPGREVQSYTSRGGGNGLTVVVRLAGGRTFEVPASSVTIASTGLQVDAPASPSAPDSAMVPNSVSVTQAVGTRDDARRLLLAQADVVGLARDDVETWYASVPATAGGAVRADEFHFNDIPAVGYVRLGAAADLGYDASGVTWTFSWSPPIPGYTYDASGYPQPTSS